MFRYLFSLFLAVSLFAYDDSSVSYMGMTIQCPEGDCTNYYSNPNLRWASECVQDLVKKTFRYPNQSPVVLDVWPNCSTFQIWRCDDSETEFSAYDWQSTGGFYDVMGYYPNCKEPRKTYSLKNYVGFLDLAEALRRDVRFYYRDAIQQEINLYRKTLPILRNKQKEYLSVRWNYEAENYLEFDGNTLIYDFIQNLKEELPRLKNRLVSDEYDEKCEEIERAIAKLDKIYRRIFSWCLANHQEEGIIFNGVLEDFLRDEFDSAIDQIRFLIEKAEMLQAENELLAKLYLLKGQIQSEFGLYADAVIGLTEAIRKNPSLKDSYFERASCYFELGNFDQAIEDFIASEFHSRPVESFSQLGLGVSTGIVAGAGESALEFIPSLIGTVRGLGTGLWALLQHPLQTSGQFLDAATRCVEFIRAHSTLDILQTMVPELRELVQNYDRLSDFETGERIGHVVGKYGMDVFLAKEGVLLVKAARELKTADRMMTLEALASSKSRQELLTLAENHRLLKETAIRNGSLKIHEGRQGKHIRGHPNYDDILKQGKRPQPSVFEHSDPNRLLRDFAGTGIKQRGNLPFTSGYAEVVDFKEPIGFVVLPGTGEKIPTTLGKIHYGQDGVHIVPFVPKKGGS